MRDNMQTDSEGNKVNISEYFGIKQNSRTAPDSLEKLQVLSPNRSGFYGVSGLNLHFQEDIRAKVEYQHGSGDVLFKTLDKVMHTKNEYKQNELFVSNGSLGGVTGNQKVHFLEREKPVKFTELQHKESLELAYAITVHKSQGSGFNNVFVVLPGNSKFVSRELLYTALTRTKNKVFLFINKPNDDFSIPNYLEKIKNISSILNRKTALLLDTKTRYAYNPDEGIEVKSRVEYIIYKKLKEGQAKYGNFNFSYEEKYELKNHNFDIHPDFVLRFDDGRIVYWEHLGRVLSKSYMRGWDSRKELYEENNDFKNVITTDELSGIDDDKIDTIIAMLVENKLTTEDSSNRYSDMHFSLR